MSKKSTKHIVPTLKLLENAYTKLMHFKPHPPTIDDIALYTQWSRFDPRLSELLVIHFAKHWRKINPIFFRQSILHYPWASVIGVFFLFVRQMVKQENSPDLDLYDGWSKLITTGFKRASGEQFFMGLRKIADEQMLHDVQFSIKPYISWGYYSRENLIPKSGSGHLNADTRKNMLLHLANTSKRITTSDYLKAIGNCISRRQAQRELLSSSFLNPSGKTKGKTFTVRRNT